MIVSHQASAEKSLRLHEYVVATFVSKTIILSSSLKEHSSLLHTTQTLLRFCLNENFVIYFFTHAALQITTPVLYIHCCMYMYQTL
jgi:hypothetical protein